MVSSAIDCAHVNSGSKSGEGRGGKTMLEIPASHAASNFHFCFLFTGDETWLLYVYMPICLSHPNHVENLS
jgi:hypothetical protein